MTRIAYFDCFAGASGDMVVGALINLGFDPGYLKEELKKIPLSDYEISVSPVLKSGIHAIRFEVTLTNKTHKVVADQEFIESPGGNENPANEHHNHQLHPYRSYRDIINIINQSKLSPKIISKVLMIFSRLAEAEALSHGVAVEDVHFHEVGGTDAIIDISSAVIGFDVLEITDIVVSPFHLGSGFIQTAHGLLPVPAPATVHLLKGFPVYTTELKGEFVTPTGAAILTSLSNKSGSMPPLIIQKIGHGAGKREREFPNVLRCFLGEPTDPSPPNSPNTTLNRNPYPDQHDQPLTENGFHENDAVILEANIDDMNPQFYSNLIDLLLNAGALDVTLTPTQMKKNRPGIILQILSHPLTVSRLINLVFRESSTIGIRSYPVTKHMLQREISTIQTIYGEVKVKISRLKDDVVTVSPEYESCLQLSQKIGIPVKDIYAKALGDAHTLFLDVGK